MNSRGQDEKQRVTIWMPADLKNALLVKARESGMPASTIVETLLKKYLDRVVFEVEAKEVQPGECRAAEKEGIRRKL